MCNMTKVRSLQSTEHAVVAGWLAELPLMTRYKTTASVLQRQLNEAAVSGELLLTVDHAQTPAVGLAWIMPRGAFGRSAYLRLLGVHRDHAGDGLGSKLLHAAETHSAIANRDLFLLVSDFNTPAQRFYQRHGYTQVGTLPGYVVPDVTELIFWKRSSGR